MGVKLDIGVDWATLEKKALHNKWVYRIKELDDSKHSEARLVVWGISTKDVDTMIFSPIVKLTTIKFVLGIVASKD